MYIEINFLLGEQSVCPFWRRNLWKHPNKKFFEYVELYVV